MSQTPQKNELPKPKSALDVVVNQLVRASVGGVPSTISDESLDKYVADLILKEAAAKNKQYNKEGVRAYLPHTGTPPCNLPKTNKRFLFNVVKNVDDHNQALIRRTEEEAAARMRALKRKDRSRRYDSDDERSYRSSRRRDRERSSRNDYDSYHRGNRRSSRYYSEDDIDSDTSSSERGRKLSYKEKYHDRKASSRSPSSRTKSSRRSVSPISSSSSHLDKVSSSRLDNKDSLNVSSTSRKEGTLSIDSNSINKSTSKINNNNNVVIKKGRGEVSNGSKMDKYFRKDYDPMFDIEPFIGGETDLFNYEHFEQILMEKSIDEDSKKKKKKHKEKSKHKKEKHKSSNSSSKSKKKRRRNSDSGISSSSSSDSEEDHKKRRKNDLKPKIYESVREWDKPKLSSGPWDPDKTI